ncbi:hypothetical protein ABIA32_003074 [Streptacidiphilus sp. MAP12-20]|uniref:hypothetical protein n=1 Tax=Streptacidiphilus sp. MAP12-20 TaxID=3156299 RepID=UPI003518DF14
MTASTWPNQECPVYVASLMPGQAQRIVQIMRADGTLTEPEGCRNAHELARLVHHERPDVDLADPAQTYWVDRPGQWPAA